MAEPQPSSIHEGLDPDAAPAPTGADARKAAAALSSIDARGEEDETAQSSTVKNIDQEALGQAISRLELSTGKVTPGGEEQKRREAERRKERERRAKVKVDAGDVGLLVEELDLSKMKATELLKANEGDVGKAMMAFVTANLA